MIDALYWTEGIFSLAPKLLICLLTALVFCFMTAVALVFSSSNLANVSSSLFSRSGRVLKREYQD